MSLDTEKNYQTVQETIRKHGKPNPQYATDLDIDYGTLSKIVNFGGLPAILKNMKKKKMVDFADQGFFKDGSIITLIGDYEAEATSQQVTYDQINEAIEGDGTSHTKVSSW